MSSEPSSTVFLSSLLASLPASLRAQSLQPLITQSTDPPITGLSLDSRLVQPGCLFVALTGGMTDGHRYIPDAIQRGADAIVGTQALSHLAVPYLQVTDSRAALAALSAAFYDFPARCLTVIGVTGTDGKTTTSNLIHSILQTAGLRVGMVSTVSALIGDQALDTGFHVTTPEAPDVQHYLAMMVAAGLTHVVLEATSHGLAQQRVGACDFDLGVVTNVTHEHLDYHGSYAAYLEAKATLFRWLVETPAKDFNPPRGAVLNRDDSSYEYLADMTRIRQVSYGMHPGADFRVEGVQQLPDGLHFNTLWQDTHGKETRLPVFTPLWGLFNVSNCLAALAVAIGVLDLDPSAAQQGIARMPGVPGRMERIDLGQDFIAIVDFAHTPNALSVTLESVRQMAKTLNGRVIAVFGSAGLRDRAKRRMMAEVSAVLADISVFTAEDPRTESLTSILSEMAVGAESKGSVEGQAFWRIPDRREALRFAVGLAQAGDVLVACGKGHEQSMCFGMAEYSWDDRVALRAALAEQLGLTGYPMPYLPEV